MGKTMNENSQAILLLTARFAPTKPGTPSPLGPAEYGRLASWLHEKAYEPRQLLRAPEKLLAAWSDPRGKITMERIVSLLNRTMTMGIALEKWHGAGLWILTRADPDYPERLHKRLGNNRPPVLFGAGNKELLSKGGLAIVGSRDVAEDDRQYTAQIAKQAAKEGLNIVSGGARGVDETAMLSALEVNGTALGVIADNLLRAALSLKWRTYIKKKQLCLISSYYPEAAFHIGNAMGRNKYIYCLSDYALIIKCSKGKGGTWSGATENLRKNWTKQLFVKDDQESPGLEDLRRRGARPIHVPTDMRARKEWLRDVLEQGKQVVSQQPKETSQTPGNLFYNFFLEQISPMLDEKQKITLKELKESFPDLHQTQITDWLDKAVKEGHLKRGGNRRVYSRPGQRSDHFDDDALQLNI